MAERLQELNNRRRECDSADEALREIDATLAALPADAPECAAAVLKRIEVLGSEIQAAREAYQQNEVAARTVLQQGPYTGLAAAEERVRQLEADEAAETLRLDAIRRLKNAVDSAKDEALAGIAEPVEARATRIVERIVGRPLARIQLGGSMELESVHPDGCSGAAVLEQMSAGEQEQIYFATRLALAEVLSEQERQVLVLDDPLVNTDGERIAESWI
jgi:DNA repair exonuclease SbcCD ATPase subunit